ncbi:MAG: CCA tRNA nucleotidyltransferase [Phycisphaerales bacterium]
MARAPDPAIARREATMIVRALRDRGHVAYFAGGCVRDELLGLHPTDYDVATDARPEQVRAAFRRVHEVGAAFGVMLVPTNGVTIEVATFRTEGTYSDRRRPDSVSFATPELDAARRDFTINALFLDPLAPPTPLPPPLPRVEGALIDLVGGVDDLRAGVIRAVGDPHRRLAEDHLRALRAVRFAARLGFSIAPDTTSAIREHARELEGVSRERIGEEVRRMLDHPSRGTAAALLNSLALDAPVLQEPPRPSSPDTAGEPSILARLPRSAPHPTALAAWALDRHAGAGVAAGTLVEPARQALIAGWRRALCLSNKDRDALDDTLAAHAVLIKNWAELGIAPRKRAFGRMEFREALVILGVSAKSLASAISSDLAAIGVDLTRSPPSPWVNGGDLIRLGLKPGPAFKRILNAVYDAQLDGSAGSKAEALELARRLRV